MAGKINQSMPGSICLPECSLTYSCNSQAISKD